MSNYGILSCLEEIASSHSDKVGYGVNDIESKKKVWLLMDWKLKVIERPEYGSKIKVETWARPIEKRPFSTYRDFKMFNNGKISAIGTSKWILFDLETNKIAKITEDIIDLYKPEPEKVFEKDEAIFWQCRNCGFVIEAKKAPMKCPACEHPQAFFEPMKQNY